MIKYQLQILHLLDIQTLEVIFYLCRKFIAMIKSETVEYQISSKQQNQVVQQIIRDQLFCLLLEIVSCSLKLVQIIIVIMYMIGSNELMLCKCPMKLSIIIDFQF